MRLAAFAMLMLGCSALRVSRRVALPGAAALAVSPLAAFAQESDSISSTVLVEGDKSSPLPQRAQKVVVDYSLWLNDFEGKLIDSSKGSTFPPKLPSPFSFTVGVGAVIKGWDRTVKEMHVGEKRRVVIPASLGYGDKGVGPIPGGANLYFEIELLELRPVKPLTDKQKDWLEAHPDS